MNKIKFLNFLNHPESISESDLSKLEALAEQYPYSQIIHILVAKGRHNLGLETFRLGLHRAALSANNRDLLKKLIEDVKVSNIIPLEAEVAPHTDQPLSAEAPEETITSTEEVISESVKEQALTPEVAAPEEQESIQKEVSANTKKEDSQSEVPLPEADQPDTPTEMELDITQNDLVKQELEASEKLSLATDNQDVPDEKGIHSELMANLKKLRQQREKLDEEKEEEAASEDSIKETTDDDSSVSTNNDTEANQTDNADKPVESEALFYDPPMEELTEASFIADKEANHPDEVEESVENSITEEQKSQLEIIDSFIKNSPVLSKPNLSADSEATSQTDLSIKSAKFHQDFASENLATILVKQGKRKDAVGIYKKLMVKFPEKKAYFADQIESLNTK